jgi:hypothetical protein
MDNGRLTIYHVRVPPLLNNNFSIKNKIIEKLAKHVFENVEDGDIDSHTWFPYLKKEGS